MGLEDDIPDTPEARHTTLRLANTACQASTTTRVSVPSHVPAKSPAQIAAANDLKITSNALCIATQKCQLVMTVVTSHFG